MAYVAFMKRSSVSELEMCHSRAFKLIRKQANLHIAKISFSHNHKRTKHDDPSQRSVERGSFVCREASSSGHCWPKEKESEIMIHNEVTLLGRRNETMIMVQNVDIPKGTLETFVRKASKKGQF